MANRLFRVATLAGALLNLGAAEAPPADYPARASELDAETRAICQAAAQAQPPASDWPTPAEVRALKGCSSVDLYYGIGRKADPIRARKCALLEWRQAPREPDEFGGGGLLMMIYANGRGARRDVDSPSTCFAA